MPYFTHEVAITDYGWTVKFYQPTYGELNELQGATKNETELKQSLLPLIADWNCTDRTEQVLPISVEGLDHLPATVLIEIIRAIFESTQGTVSPKAPAAS